MYETKESMLFRQILRKDIYRSMQTNADVAHSLIRTSLDEAKRRNYREAAEMAQKAVHAFLRAADNKDAYEVCASASEDAKVGVPQTIGTKEAVGILRVIFLREPLGVSILHHYDPPYNIESAAKKETNVTMAAVKIKGFAQCEEKHAILRLRGEVNSGRLSLDILIWGVYNPSLHDLCLPNEPPPDLIYNVNLSKESPHCEEIFTLLQTHAPCLLEKYQNNKTRMKEKLQDR